MKVSIQLLGSFSIFIDQQAVSLGNVARIQALFAFLALQPGTAILRATLAFQLWPDSSEKQAQTNLRKLLYQLRQAFPENSFTFLYTDAKQVQLARLNAQVDLLEFETAIETADQHRKEAQRSSEETALCRAAGIYRGDLLPGCYDDWLVPERERIRQKLVSCLERLVFLLQEKKDYSGAIEFASRLLQMDPLREESYRQLIRLYSQKGDRAAALNVYHNCAKTLETELGVEPGDATRRLYEHLLDRDASLIIPAIPMRNPLVAREHEWAALSTSWKQALAGKIQVHILRGETGIGKTRLAEDFINSVSRQGKAIACTAACYENDQSAFTPVVSWLKTLPLKHLAPHRRLEVARLLPDLRNPDDNLPSITTGDWQRISFFDAIGDALLGTGTPLVLLLDDIQWCDRDTFDLVRYLIRTHPMNKVLVIATLREGETVTGSLLDKLLADLRLQGRLAETSLLRLDAHQTAKLAAGICGDKIPAAFLHKETEGVPLFIVEMARKTLETSSQTEPGSTSISSTLLAGRIEKLSFSARSLAQAAAVFGRGFAPSMLSAISGLSEAETMLALDELWQRRIIREAGNGTYCFSHIRLQEAVSINMSPVRLGWLHLQSARVFESAGEFTQAASHYAAAGERKQATKNFRIAAEHALRVFAVDEACKLLEQALALETHPDFQLYEQYGDTLGIAGLLQNANDAYGRALVACQPGDWRSQVRLHRKMMNCVSRLDYDIARSAYQQGTADLLNAPKKDTDYWAEWLELHLNWYRANYWAGNIQEMTRLLDLIREPIQKHGTIVQQVQFWHDQLQIQVVQNRYIAKKEQVILARKNVETAQNLGSPLELSERLSSLGFMAFCAGEFVESQQAYTECLAIARLHGFLNVAERCHAYLSLVYRRLGQSQDVENELQSLDIIVLKTQSRSYRWLVLAQRAWLLYRQADFAAAKRLANDSVQGWQAEKNTYPVQWPGRIVLLAISIADRDDESARQQARGLLAHPQQRLDATLEHALETTLESDVPAGWQHIIDIAHIVGYL